MNFEIQKKKKMGKIKILNVNIYLFTIYDIAVCNR